MLFLRKRYILIIMTKMRFVKGEKTVYLPDHVKNVLDILKKNGYEGYAVGGCVRDSLLGKTPDDYDIAVSSFPEETKKCFEGFRVIETGIKHGTVTVLSDGHPLELTTFRCDGEYKDDRHPENVTFTRSLENDLARRDFTVNAMAYSPEKGLTDLFGGRQDLERGVIRCVGDPYERFTEDALRIMRCIRFASALGFEIEKNTADAARALAGRLKNISAERIFVELKKLLNGNAAGRVLTEYRDIVETVFPPFCDVPDEAYAFAAHSVSAFGDTPLKVTAFLSPLGADGAGEVLSLLKSDNAQRKTTEFILTNKNRVFSSVGEVKRFCGENGVERVKALALFRRIAGTEDNGVLEEGINAAEKKNVCLKITDLAVDGSDIAQLGFRGKEIGNALQTLLEAVTDGKVENEKEMLTGFIDRYK